MDQIAQSLCTRGGRRPSHPSTPRSAKKTQRLRSENQVSGPALIRSAKNHPFHRPQALREADCTGLPRLLAQRTEKRTLSWRVCPVGPSQDEPGVVSQGVAGGPAGNVQVEAKNLIIGALCFMGSDFSLFS